MKAEYIQHLKDNGLSDKDIEIAKLEGWCEVNGILLRNIDRYRYAEMQFCMPKTHIKKTEKHLKDCPKCLNRVFQKNPECLPKKLLKLVTVKSDTKRTQP